VLFSSNNILAEVFNAPPHSQATAVKTLLRAFIRYCTGHLKRAWRCTARQRRALQAAGYPNQPPHLPSASDSSSENLSASSDSDSDSTFDWSDVLGPDWRGSSDTSESSQNDGSYSRLPKKVTHSHQSRVSCWHNSPSQHTCNLYRRVFIVVVAMINSIQTHNDSIEWKKVV
jgi:hypothetical protein